MKKVALIIGLLAALPGCALHHVRSDPDAVRFARVWETPRLEQQVVGLELSAEADRDHEKLFREATDVLLDSGKFRIAEPGEETAFIIEMTLSVRRDTHVLKTLCNALILYAWPIDARDYMYEVFVDVRKPSGELVGHCYAQGRGRYELWLGYLVWPEWLWNNKEAATIRRDALKAATVKICRSLTPGTGQ